MQNDQQKIKSTTKLEEAINAKEKSKNKEQMVEGIFKNWEVRGAPITFSYCDDKGPAKKYTLEDGKKYVLPLKVAKHINRCAYPVSQAETDKHGHYLRKREGMVRRYTFRRVDDLMGDTD